ncbi:hypothetical protein WR25_26031 [Diploscapter pachys]|uniref:Uncharacterized protein n=1 Tax=Diploscapter pachys TaxID=2018661 RepID=A0A2A2K4U0_9BILA|nr:hypothetical protein WR25_26031 [Diploscapter pachys]
MDVHAAIEAIRRDEPALGKHHDRRGLGAGMGVDQVEKVPCRITADIVGRQDHETARPARGSRLVARLGPASWKRPAGHRRDRRGRQIVAAQVGGEGAPRGIEQVGAVPAAIGEAPVIGGTAFAERYVRGDAVRVMMRPARVCGIPAIGIAARTIPDIAIVVAPLQECDVAIVTASLLDLGLREGEVGRLALCPGFGRDRVVDDAHRGDPLAAARHARFHRRLCRQIGEACGRVRASTQDRPGRTVVLPAALRRSSVEGRGQRHPLCRVERRQIDLSRLVAPAHRGAVKPDQTVRPVPECDLALGTAHREDMAVDVVVAVFGTQQRVLENPGRAVPVDTVSGDDDAPASELARMKPVAVARPRKAARQRGGTGDADQFGDRLDTELVTGEQRLHQAVRVGFGQVDPAVQVREAPIVEQVEEALEHARSFRREQRMEGGAETVVAEREILVGAIGVEDVDRALGEPQHVRLPGSDGGCGEPCAGSRGLGGEGGGKVGMKDGEVGYRESAVAGRTRRHQRADDDGSGVDMIDDRHRSGVADRRAETRLDPAEVVVVGDGPEAAPCGRRAVARDQRAAIRLDLERIQRVEVGRPAELRAIFFGRTGTKVDRVGHGGGSPSIQYRIDHPFPLPFATPGQAGSAGNEPPGSKLRFAIRLPERLQPVGFETDGKVGWKAGPARRDRHRLAGVGKLADRGAVPCHGLFLAGEVGMRTQHLYEEGLHRPVPSDEDGGRAIEAGELVAAHGDNLLVRLQACSIQGATDAALAQSPVAVKDGIGKIAGEQIVEHRGLAGDLVRERVPVERVEEVLASLEVAGQPRDLGTRGGDGGIDVHGRSPVRRSSVPAAPQAPSARGRGGCGAQAVRGR